MERLDNELRMYFFVISSLCGISKGIMCGHAALEYALKYGETDLFKEFVNEHKTWVILNGGTTNDERDFDSEPLGTLNKIGDQLTENDVDFSFFREPDLNNAVTAICFICDERVFDRKQYPDFKEHILNTSGLEFDTVWYMETKMKSDEELIEEYPSIYKTWVRNIGGVKNVFLRDLIKDKKLA